MPTKDMEVSNLFIVDQNTGKREEFKGIAKAIITTKDKNDCKLNMNVTEPREITGTFEIKDKRALRELLYKTITVRGSLDEIVKTLFVNRPLNRMIVHLEFKQNRTHKRNRSRL